MSYDAVLFDNDGVLTHLTATNVWHTAVRDAFAEFDTDPADESVERIVNGDLGSVECVCTDHDVDTADFWVAYEHHAATAQRAAMEDGTKPLYDDVSSLYDLTVPLAVVSNNQHATVEHIVDVFDLDDLFSVAYGRSPSLDGFRRRKPSPHYLELALDEMGLVVGDDDRSDRSSVLYVGDSNVDLIAAERAGLDSAFVRRPHRADYELAADPTHEVRSLDEVVAMVSVGESAKV